ncbi:hypothetical protein ABZZ20_07225 [Streptomyces sp. NPDC006430]|uniref:hypothetical protein n=1 Tax=Streptomyces sp. NPDC006430 TaxID=3154299 RepID=UPI0033B81C54
MNMTRGLVGLALLAVPLCGCSMFPPFATCGGREGALTALAGLPVLSARPDGATVPPGFEAADTGCLDDSGEPWLYAGRLYVTAQGQDAVVRFYREAAQADAWREQPPPSPVPAKVAGLCFERTDAGKSRTLDLRFLGPDEAREVYGYTPEPSAPPRTVYYLEADAPADGSSTACFRGEH